jgi:hypothetical protein
VTVAAAVLSQDQVSKLFAGDLNKAGYMVVEVAVFPDSGNEVEVLSRDFLMRAGSEKETLRPVSSVTIAARQQQKNTPKVPPTPGNVSVYPTSTIGWETGGYDPVTGRRRSGVYTGGGVGVGVGGQREPYPAPPGSTDADRNLMEQELFSKELPQGKTVEPVAGYLYFPKPSSSKARNGPLHITYYTEHERMELEVPALKK